MPQKLIFLVTIFLITRKETSDILLQMWLFWGLCIYFEHLTWVPQYGG